MHSVLGPWDSALSLQDFIDAIRRSLDGLETLALEQNAA